MNIEGLVVKSTGSWYQVRAKDGVTFSCRLKGIFRKENIDTSNPIAVGDQVLLGGEDLENLVITEIRKRRNYIIRKSNKLSKQRQILAANLDLLIIVASVVSPRTSNGFIDRILLCAEAYHVPVLILFNKCDLVHPEDLEIVKTNAELYRQVGYSVITGSVTEEGTIQRLKKEILHKTVLVSGHSGVGKSTLINSLIPGLDSKTQEISEQHAKGKHTTTFAEMHFGEHGLQIIDTPGIRDFGIVDIAPEESGQYFPEIKKYSGYCKFNNCRHITEPGCAVLQAVEEEKINPLRYYSYLSIYRNEDVFN